MNYVMVAMAITTAAICIVMMATGAYFSRPVGTKLGLAGGLSGAITCTIGAELNAPWWALVAPFMFGMLCSLLGIAAIGGEE